MAALTPTTMKTSDLINLISNDGALVSALTDQPTPGSAPAPIDPATFTSARQSLLDEIDRRMPIPS